MQYVLALQQPEDRVAALVRNRVHEQTMPQIMQVPTCMLRGIELVFVYRPRNSAAALSRKGKKNLLGLQRDFPLTDAEANTVENGVNASKSSSRSSQTLRPRRVLLFGGFRANTFRSNRRTKGAIDASGMGRL